MRLRAIWRFITSQPASFWLINFYLFIEYVRPQSIYRSIDVLPWGQTALLLTLLAVVLEGKLLKRPGSVADPLLAVFSLILVASSVAAIYPDVAYGAWELYFSWVLVYILITSTVTTEKRFFIFMLAFLLFSFKMSQHGSRSWVLNGFAFRDWGAAGAPGWFQNSGEFGVQMCVFLPLSVEFILALRSHWGRVTRWVFYLFPVTAVASMVSSSSRGALVGGAAVALWWVARSKHRVRALLAVAVVGAATWAVVPPEQKARFAAAGEDDSSTNRIERWEDGLEMAKDNPLLGIGYENWGRHYGGRLPHNIFIEAASELGFTGFFAFLALIFGTFYINARTRRLVRSIPTETEFLKHMAFGLDGALIGYMGSGFFVTVLYYPFFWINLAMAVALHTAARRKRRVFAFRANQVRSRRPEPATRPAPLAGPS